MMVVVVVFVVAAVVVTMVSIMNVSILLHGYSIVSFYTTLRNSSSSSYHDARNLGSRVSCICETHRTLDTAHLQAAAGFHPRGSHPPRLAPPPPCGPNPKP